METSTQLVDGIKMAINNVPLKSNGDNNTYQFVFNVQLEKVIITDENGYSHEYPVRLIYNDRLDVFIGDNVYSISSFIQDGKLKLSLNNGQIILVN